MADWDTLQLLTPAEAAKLLAISTIHLRDLSTHGDISYVNVGVGKPRETRRYRLTDIQRFTQDRTLISPIRRSTRAPLEITDEDLLKAADSGPRSEATRGRIGRHCDETTARPGT